MSILNFKQSKKYIWNKCDECGRFIPFKDFEEGAAKHEMVTPESELTHEEWVTLCKDHNK